MDLADRKELGMQPSFMGLAKLKREGDIVAYDDTLLVIEMARLALSKMKRSVRVKRQADEALALAEQELKRLREQGLW